MVRRKKQNDWTDGTLVAKIEAYAEEHNVSALKACEALNADKGQFYQHRSKLRGGAKKTTKQHKKPVFTDIPINNQTGSMKMVIITGSGSEIKPMLEGLWR